MLQKQIGKVISFRCQFNSLSERIDKLERFIDLVNGNLDKIEKITAFVDRQASDDVVVKTHDYFQGLIDQTKAALMLNHTADGGNAEGETEEDIIGRNLRDGLFQSIPVVRIGDYITSCATSADCANLNTDVVGNGGAAAAAPGNLDENANAVINVDGHADAFANAADVYIDVDEEEQEQEQEEEVDSGADVGSDEDIDTDENSMAVFDPDMPSNEGADVNADDADGTDSFEEEKAYSVPGADAINDNDPDADTDSDVNGDAYLEAVADAATAAN